MPTTKPLRDDTPVTEARTPDKTDRQALRETLNKRFKHTLRRLAQ